MILDYNYKILYERKGCEIRKIHYLSMESYQVR